MAHKLHSAAKKTFQMSRKESDLISAIVHTSLQLSEAGAAKKMREACSEIAREELRVIRRPALVDEAGQMLKNEVLALFMPEEPRKKAWISQLAAFLNGDWRHVELQHYCDGCCADHEEASTKLACMLSKMVTTLRPPIFNEANWMSWSSCLRLLGLGGAMHNILARVFFKSRSDRALVPDIADPQAEQDEIEVDVDAPGLMVHGQVVPPIAFAADDDDLERLRKQRKHSLQVTECFFRVATSTMYSCCELHCMARSPSCLSCFTPPAKLHWLSVWRSSERRVRQLSLFWSCGDLQPLKGWRKRLSNICTHLWSVSRCLQLKLSDQVH